MLGTRIRDRLKVLGMSQSALARRAGVPQTTLNGLINSEARSTPHLTRIARELRTSPAYLVGDTDDPDADAPPPPPEPRLQLVPMQVALPSERALARMFEALLRPLDLTASKVELAETLARWLPIGLSQLRDLLPEQDPPAAAEDRRELAEAAATPHPARP